MILFYIKYNKNILDLILKGIKDKNSLSNPKKKNTKKRNKNKIIELGDSKLIINKEIKKKKKKKKKEKKKKKKKNNSIQETINKNYKNKESKKKIYKLIDEELNTLNYERAIIIDKRSFIQYYLSLIKKKNLIIFSFYPNNDYNLILMKICLFLISFNLYFTLNILFFTDKTMIKIRKHDGIYNFINQLPKIIYSTLIISFVNLIIKTQKNIKI